MVKSSSTTIFDNNRSLILKTIRLKGQISRVDLTKLTRISPPTVTRVVNSLIKEGLVRKVGIGHSSGGRPPVILEFNSLNSFVIGIDWDLKNIKGVISNLEGDIIYQEECSNPHSQSIESDLELVKKLISSLASHANVSFENIRGIGIAVAGYVNKRTGNIEFSPVQRWKDVNIKQPLQDAFGLPVYLDYAGRVVALSESLYGKSKNVESLIYINVNYGMGAGLIIDHKLYSGFDGFAGELGHQYIQPLDQEEKRVCVCGKINCLSEYASGRGLEKSFTRALELNKEQKALWKEADLSYLDLLKKAEAGDSFFQRILFDGAVLLGQAIANLSNVINPEKVILGGQVFFSDYFTDQVINTFKEISLRGTGRNIPIERALNSDQAAVTGAVALVLKHILDFDIMEN